MIAYNPKDWFTFIFRFHKSDTVRQLFPMIIAIAIYSTCISYLEIYVVKLEKDSQLKNLSLIYSMLGFVISMLLVFRTNTAYDRWWEGRRLWGQLINCSRNLSIKINQILSNDSIHKQALKTLIPYFAVALRSHLRNEHTIPDLDENASTKDRFDFHENIKHLPNHVAKEIFEEIDLLYKEKQLTDAQLLIIHQDFQQFTEICGACERIKNSPIPYSYSAFLKKFIFFYIMLMPFAYIASLGFTIIPVTVFTFYVLTSIELIAEEIENPFGLDANDLPLDELCKNIKRTSAEIFS
jgi:putative membrane protein